LIRSLHHLRGELISLSGHRKQKSWLGYCTRLPVASMEAV